VKDINTTRGIEEVSRPSRDVAMRTASNLSQHTGPHRIPWALCLALALLAGMAAGLGACASGEDTILSAEDIQATVNAIVTASASPPSQASTPVPFNIMPAVDPGWGSEVVRVVPRQVTLESVQWNDDSRLEFLSSAGTYQLDPARWGNWDQAWITESGNHQTIIPSPDGSHHILLENHMWIIRKFDGNPIGLIGDVPQAVSWTSDGSAVVFAITSVGAELEQGLYSWPVESPNPTLVLAEQSSIGQVAISPSGAQAAYLVDSGAPGVITLRLVDLPSSEAETRRLDLPQGWRLEGWVTDELLELSLGVSSQSFVWYNLESQALFQVQEGESQTAMTAPLPSPDGQWVAGQSIQVNSNQTGDMPTSQVEHVYFVSDLETDENHNLAFGNDSAIEYLTWSPDSRRLFLVSCPTHEDARAFETAPFGLLAFDPENNSSEILFGKAVQASLNPMQQWAYVAFPSLDPEDNRVLSGALWEIGSQALLHRRVLLDEFVFRDPTSNNDAEPAIYFYARWSHDGQKLVVVDPAGSLVLYDINGLVEVLHTNLFGDSENWVGAMQNLRYGGLYWSPNDRYLLVDFNGTYLVRLDT
jgi:hypothetical protein